MILLTLPYPPSVNKAWRAVCSARGGRPMLYVSADHKAFRQAVAHEVSRHGYQRKGALLGPLGITVDLCPPDRRRRDIDNPIKALLDALTHAGVFQDDSQIEELHVHRAEVTPGGRCSIELWEIGG